MCSSDRHSRRGTSPGYFEPAAANSTKDVIMTEIKHHTIRANDIRQHYMESGEGAPVVLLHGFPETSYAWRHQIPELARKYRVIAPDRRGYGESHKPAPAYYSPNMPTYLRTTIHHPITHYTTL